MEAAFQQRCKDVFGNLGPEIKPGFVRYSLEDADEQMSHSQVMDFLKTLPPKQEPEPLIEDTPFDEPMST